MQDDQAQSSRTNQAFRTNQVSSPSLSRRLVVVAMVWIALGLGVCGFFLSYAFERAVETSFDDRLAALLRSVVAETDMIAPQQLRIRSPLEDTRFSQVYSGWYWQLRSGSVLRSRSLWDTDLPAAGAITPGALVYRSMAGPRDQDLRAVSTVIQKADWARPVEVTVAVTTEEYKTETKAFNRLLRVSLGILGVGLGIAVVLQVTLGLRPLKRVIAELTAMKRGDGQYLSYGHPREILPLVDAFNDLRDHDLETLTRARREAGNLAHGLKTPLARLAARAEEFGPDGRERLRPDIEEIRRRIDYHVVRSTVSGARGTNAVKVRLHPVADDIVSGLLRLYADKAITATIAIADDLAILGEEEDLTEILGNLLENAFKWAKSGVRISATVQSSGVVELRVEDDGPGLTETEVATALEWGRRLDDTVPGTGLGLSIVSDIVRLYNGHMRFDRSPEGGLAVIVTLPGAP